MSRIITYIGIVALLITIGCASTEIHRQSIVDSQTIQKTLDDFDVVRNTFVVAKGKYNPTRTELSESFSCLLPQKIDFSEKNEAPKKLPFPVIELQGDSAIRWWKEQETFHMTTPKIAFRNMNQEEIPLLTTVECALQFESHYERGFVANTAVGQRESQRGIHSYIAFIFIRNWETGEYLLLDLRRNIKIFGVDSRVENEWYTRIFNLLSSLFSAGKETLISTKVP
ncbi:MAG: hypothetical protein AAB362_01245 [Patescibacteria group bacterium]